MSERREGNGGEGVRDEDWIEDEAFDLSELAAWADGLKLSHAEAETMLSDVMSAGTAGLRADRWLERLAGQIERTIGRIERRTVSQIRA